MEATLATLRRECELVAEVALALDEADFARPTRCPAWNVKQLLGHMYRDIDRINAGLANAAPDEPDSDSIDYWHRYDPTPGSADSLGVADRGVRVAAAYPTGRALAESYDRHWRDTLGNAADVDPDRVVVTFGPALTLEEFLKTRVLEVTVHGADLADALDREPWATPQGLEVTTTILRGLLGTNPIDLGWDDFTFSEKGTGRASLTEDERRALGGLASRFPLLA